MVPGIRERPEAPPVSHRVTCALGEGLSNVDADYEVDCCRRRCRVGVGRMQWGEETSAVTENAPGGDGAEGQAFDPDRAAPAAPIEGAVPGGTVTGMDAEPLAEMDPTVAYHAETVSILSGLVTRSLTQYVCDPTLETMVLVPDLATDIGTPNADFTEWTYTIPTG